MQKHGVYAQVTKRQVCTDLVRYTILMLNSTRNIRLNWTNEPIQVLGIKIGYGENIDMENYEAVIPKIKQIFNNWKQRGLSIMGKVQIVNTLVASLFVYKMTVLSTPTPEYIKKIDSLILDFIWNGKRAKIPLHILKLNKHSGGLNLVDLRKRDAALKITWINTINSDKKVANLMYSFVNSDLKDHIWLCNFNRKHVADILKRSTNSFWFDVLCAWSVYN